MKRDEAPIRRQNGPERDDPAHTPYVSAGASPPEFTFRALVPGILFGIVFGAANAYLGLQAGLTISTSIPVAVMTVAAFRAMRSVGLRGTLLEANLSQTIGSASSSVASGAVFTLPALFMWGIEPKLLQMTMLAIFGGLLGVLFMIPLRPLLIVRAHQDLPYPEGTACARVLIASEIGGAQARNVFLGLAAGAVFKFIFGWLKLFPTNLWMSIPWLPRGQLGIRMSSALFGVGYILGPRIAAVMVSGGLLSSLVIIPAIAIWGRERAEPLFPETTLTIAQMTAGEIWHRYVRYIGAGAVATAGLITLLRSVPTIIDSFRMGASRFTGGLAKSAPARPRTESDLPWSAVAVGTLFIILAMAAVPHVFGTVETFAVRVAAAAAVVVFAFFFVTVAARIVGIVGVTSNPISGMTIAALLATSAVFLALGWTDATGKAAAVSVGCVVAIAASISGDTAQDLKTGYLLGATPQKQQIGELIGVLTSALFVCITLLLLHRSYGFGSEELAAPQATLMKLVIDGVLEAKLPWVLVGIGIVIALLAEVARVPALPFAVGVYLPVTTMVPVFLGGLLRAAIERGARTTEEREQRRERGVLFGSGLVGGEGLLGVIVAGVVFYKSIGAKPGAGASMPLEIGHAWAPDAVTEFGALAVFAILALLLARSCKPLSD